MRLVSPLPMGPPVLMLSVGSPLNGGHVANPCNSNTSTSVCGVHNIKPCTHLTVSPFLADNLSATQSKALSRALPLPMLGLGSSTVRRRVLEPIQPSWRRISNSVHTQDAWMRTLLQLLRHSVQINTTLE